MNANAEILTGDLAAYLDLLERVTSTCPPSSGFDLDGMRIDVEHYLGQDSMLSDFRLHRSDEPLGASHHGLGVMGTSGRSVRPPRAGRVSRMALAAVALLPSRG